MERPLAGSKEEVELFAEWFANNLEAFIADMRLKIRPELAVQDDDLLQDMHKWLKLKGEVYG